jgi:predicted DCC family thiol-disulfide oxidoreductase YuxK
MDFATLILDGDCGLCNRSAIFLRPRLDKGKKIIFLTNESNEGKEIIKNLSAKRQNVDSVYLLENEKIYIRSAAAIRCLLFMKWRYKILYPFCWIIPLPLRDLVYIIISKNRHRIFSKPDVCMIPSLNDYDN